MQYNWKEVDRTHPVCEWHHRQLWNIACLSFSPYLLSSVSVPSRFCSARIGIGGTAAEMEDDGAPPPAEAAHGLCAGAGAACPAAQAEPSFGTTDHPMGQDTREQVHGGQQHGRGPRSAGQSEVPAEIGRPQRNRAPPQLCAFLFLLPGSPCWRKAHGAQRRKHRTHGRNPLQSLRAPAHSEGIPGLERCVVRLHNAAMSVLNRQNHTGDERCDFHKQGAAQQRFDSGSFVRD